MAPASVHEWIGAAQFSEYTDLEESVDRERCTVARGSMVETDGELLERRPWGWRMAGRYPKFIATRFGDGDVCCRLYRDSDRLSLIATRGAAAACYVVSYLAVMLALGGVYLAFDWYS